MAFTRTWNAAYEDTPPSSQSASQGALRIQELKEDIRERTEIDHSWAGTADDGKHKKVTLISGADAAAVAAAGIVYVKDVSAIPDLHYRNSAGTIVRITDNTQLAIQKSANTWAQAQRPTQVTLTDAATIAINASLSNAFVVTLGGNRILGFPTNGVAGQVITIRVGQGAVGSRILTYAAGYVKSTGDDLTLSTAISAEDLLVLFFRSASSVHVSIRKSITAAI